MTRPSATGERTILVVDDDAAVREFVCNVLALHRYRSVQARNGVEALVLASAIPPDLILTDLAMPELDGFGLIRRLRARSETSDIPIVVLSGNDADEATVAALDGGADDFLSKPVSSAELVARVRARLRIGGRVAALRAAVHLDDLTQLLNRRGLQAELERAVARAAPLSLLLLDLDGFKHINDTCGHAHGDAMLRVVAGVLTASVREGDAVARIGGDEFVILLPATELGCAMEIARRIERAVRALDVRPALGVSIGAASAVREAGLDADGLLKAADLAMYRSKHDRRRSTERLAVDAILR